MKIALLCLFISLNMVSNGYCAGAAKDYTPAEIIFMLQSGDEKTQYEAARALSDRNGRVKEKYKTIEIKNALFNILSKKMKPTDSFFNEHPLPVSLLLPFGILGMMGDFQEIRALPYLLANIKSGGPITVSLARMGEPAVKPILDKFQNSADEKGAALSYFRVVFSTKTPTIITERGVKISNPYTETYEPKGAIKEEIRSALKEQLDNPNSAFVFSVIGVLQLIGDPKDKKLLDDIEPAPADD